MFEKFQNSSNIFKKDGCLRFHTLWNWFKSVQDGRWWRRFWNGIKFMRRWWQIIKEKITIKW